MKVVTYRFYNKSLWIKLPSKWYKRWPGWGGSNECTDDVCQRLIRIDSVTKISLSVLIELRRSVKRGMKYRNPCQQQRLVVHCIVSNTGKRDQRDTDGKWSLAANQPCFMGTQTQMNAWNLISLVAEAPGESHNRSEGSENTNTVEFEQTQCTNKAERCVFKIILFKLHHFGLLFFRYFWLDNGLPSKHLPPVWTRVHETVVTGDTRKSIFAGGAAPHLTSCGAKWVCSVLVWHVMLGEEIRRQGMKGGHTVGGGDVCKISHPWKERRVGTVKVHFSSARLSFPQTGRTLGSAPYSKKN